MDSIIFGRFVSSQYQGHIGASEIETIELEEEINNRQITGLNPLRWPSSPLPFLAMIVGL